MRYRFLEWASRTRLAWTWASSSRMVSSLGGGASGCLALVAPAEDAEEGEGDEADGDVSADAAFGPVEDRADGEGVLEDAEAVFDAPEFGVAGTDVGAGAMPESG